MDYEKLLDLEINSDSFDDKVTLRYIFKEILLTAWEEKDKYNGIADSRWEYDVYIALIKNGYVKSIFDEEYANKLIKDLIRYCFKKKDKLIN